ncbi:JOSD [Mytilus edulis]|uniref:ubiquitinyl hydrolase 1 n=1 Tax=Mytilus edulis TaxID=6550 RepID=A0A8S3UH25_MYTED|nr:JOSD [Mytilus edulis]
MDTISDQIWMSMVNNPAQGLTVALEPMRDKEGFYSVEVLHWVLKVKGYEMHKLNAAAIKPLTTTETENNLIGHLMSEFRMAVLIIRPRTSQHWISIRYLNDTVMFLDSKVKAPRIITYEELGDYVLQNSDDPGAVYFLSSSHESTQDVHIPNKTSKDIKN